MGHSPFYFFYIRYNLPATKKNKSSRNQPILSVTETNNISRTMKINETYYKRNYRIIIKLLSSCSKWYTPILSI